MGYIYSNGNLHRSGFENRIHLHSFMFVNLGVVSVHFCSMVK